MMFATDFLWYFAKLRKNQWLTQNEIEAIQEKRLRKIIEYAYENVEFYHKRFVELGIKPNQIRTVEDLKKIPPTSRIDLQNNFPQLVSRGVKTEKCRKYRSSGSTGIPVTVLATGKTESYRAALFMRPFFENGMKLQDKTVRIAGVPENKKKWYQYFGLMRRKDVSPNKEFDSTIQLIEDFCPDVIYGHSSYIHLLGHEIIKKGMIVKKPRLIFTTAEQMSAKSRNCIKSVFASELYDLYGCVELERLGWECAEHSGYHLDIDSQVIEFIDENMEPVSSSERGNLVVTCLYNYTMPLIRYEIGDVGIHIDDECPCGRGLPLMKGIEGRKNAFVKLPSGRIIPPTSFLDIDEISTPGVGQFQVIQKNANHLVVKLVPGKGFTNATLIKVKEATQKIIGDEMQVRVDLVDQITRDPSGKLQVVKSFINNLH